MCSRTDLHDQTTGAIDFAKMHSLTRASSGRLSEPTVHLGQVCSRCSFSTNTLTTGLTSKFNLTLNHSVAATGNLWMISRRS